MRFFPYVLVAFSLFGEMTNAADQPKFSAAQQEVINAHEARAEAGNKRDEAAYSRYVADVNKYCQLTKTFAPSGKTPTPTSPS